MKWKKLKAKRERQKKEHGANREKHQIQRKLCQLSGKKEHEKVNVSVLFWGGLGSREERNS